MVQWLGRPALNFGFRSCKNYANEQKQKKRLVLIFAACRHFCKSLGCLVDRWRNGQVAELHLLRKLELKYPLLILIFVMNV